MRCETCHGAGMARAPMRVVRQKDLSYAVEMDVGRSVRTITGFSTADDAQAWVSRANLQEMRGVDQPHASQMIVLLPGAHSEAVGERYELAVETCARRKDFPHRQAW